MPNRKSGFPEEFEILWRKHKASDYKSRKEAGYAIYLLMKEELAIERQVNEVLKEAVGYYADPKNWQFMELDETEDYERLDGERPVITGGKRARTAQKKCEEIRRISELS